MQNTKNRFTHRMTFTYLFALSIIALLSIASFFTLRKVISTQETIASVINVTNRQRFLAQNVAIYALCLANAKNAADRETSKQDILTTIVEMEKAQNGLIFGDPSLKLTGRQSPQIKAFYQQKPVDAYLLDCLNTLGNHIGQFFKRKESEEQIAHLATHDTLTNLFNRRRFNEELESRLTQSNRYGAHGALLFIDLDNFKNVNDTYGHQTGDELLVNISTVLKQRLRKSDVLGRLGGDEFAVLLSNVNGEQAVTIAKQMVETVSQNGKYTKNNYTNVTASIGVALFPGHSKDLDGLIACADHAMYRAKEGGRNRFCMYRGNA